MIRSPQPSTQTLLVLDAFLHNTKDWRYGYDISRDTGLKSGTLYPILIRLASRKLLVTSWENSEPGRPPRHLYRLTAAGMQFARENSFSRNSSQVEQATFSEARS